MPKAGVIGTCLVQMWRGKSCDFFSLHERVTLFRPSKERAFRNGTCHTALPGNLANNG